MNLRVFVCLAIVSLVACNPTPSNNPNTSPKPGPVPNPSGMVSLAVIATGLDNPLYLTNTGTGKDLYVVEKTGRVKILENAGGTPRATPFLDVSIKLAAGDERGLLSIAFHPQYAMNGFVFAYYTATDGALTVSRFKANLVTKTVDTVSEKVLLRIPHPAGNHNGGQLQFGLDGFLYIGTGDGGGAGDPDGNGHNKQTLLGKLLRIDVNSSALEGYGIPNDNPFRVAGGAPEIWAYGLRNPWRFSFDRATNDLWIGDVGQDKFEEVNVTPKGLSAPRNYGWNTTEGKSCYKASTCDKTGIDLPIFDYGRNDGDTSVTGGYVYRGAASPKIAGKYFYADFSSGRVWSLTRSGANITNALELDTSDNISSFGEGADGELYVVTLGGKVSRLVVR
jgi:glucose/arabinose dehydrogenase